MKVLALMTNTEQTACTRFRLLQYRPMLEAAGITIDARPLLDEKLEKALYRSGGRLGPKAFGITKALAKRTRDLIDGLNADVIYILREASLVGPPVIEWVLSKAGRRPVIFDLDDPIWKSYSSPNYGPLAMLLKMPKKAETIFRLATHIVAGNDYVADYARKFNPNVTVIPTVVDTDKYTPREELQNIEAPSSGKKTTGKSNNKSNSKTNSKTNSKGKGKKPSKNPGKTTKSTGKSTKKPANAAGTQGVENTPQAQDPQAPQTPVVGWIGSHSTSPYLRRILPALQAAAWKAPFKLHIIGSRDPLTLPGTTQLPGTQVIRKPWSLEREISDFQALDIGLYPITRDKWSVGKSAFKAVQYGAVSIPTIASPVGAVTQVIQHEKTGILADTTDEWIQAVIALVQDATLRRTMGRNARTRIEEEYSLATWAPRLIQVIEQSLARNNRNT